jgi:drug/metabolite transporter (DMT)-like permease
LYAILAILFWSTVASAFKISLRYLDFKQLLFYSSLVSLLALSVLMFSSGGFRKLKTIPSGEWRLSLLLGFFNPFLYYFILFRAYDILPAQEAMTLNYTWPLMLALLSAPVLGQKLGVKSIIALLISFSGIILIATNGKPASLEFTNGFGDLLAIGSSVIWALFWLFNAKSHLNEILKLFLNFLWGSIYIFLFLLFTGELSLPHTYGLAGAVYIGLFEMGFTFVLWLKAMQLTRRTDKISQLVFLSPFLSLVFISIFVGEKIHLYTLGGLFLIVSGIILQRYKLKT